MDNNSERMRILEMIENGEISAEQGLQMLAALQQEEPRQSPPAAERLQAVSELPAESAAPAEPASTGSVDAGVSTGATSPSPSDQTTRGEPLKPEVISPEQRQDFARWKDYWTIPLWIGVSITILGAALISWAVQSGKIGFWFYCALLPVMFGVLLIAIGSWSRTARWLHVRVQQPPGEKPQRIAISFPLPVTLAIWFFRVFRHRIPGMENVPQNIDELLVSVRDSTSPENPLYIRVDDDEDGEQVEIFIG
jgi:uncharacterized membrane protein